MGSVDVSSKKNQPATNGRPAQRDRRVGDARAQDDASRSRREGDK
jgi:hypothetical protein